MKSTMRGLLLLPTLLLLGCGANWQEFSPPGGNFSVMMRGTPKEDTQGGPFGMTMKMYSTTERDGAYMVAYADIPPGSPGFHAMPNERLDGARDGAVRNVNGKLLQEKQITLDGHPGREIDVEITTPKLGLIRARIYDVNKRFYMIQAIGEKTWVNSANAAKFLDSFKLKN